jgi:hypothetical protein
MQSQVSRFKTFAGNGVGGCAHKFTFVNHPPDSIAPRPARVNSLTLTGLTKYIYSVTLFLSFIAITPGGKNEPYN